MDIKKYFDKLNNEAQTVFCRSMSNKESFGQLHHFSSCIHEFAASISDVKEREMLEVVSVQLESANLSLAFGLYRQAFSSLRLALEMGLAAIYFSVNKIELYEWLDGRADIKWSKLIDENDGVLSKRFVRAFFPGMSDYVEEERERAVKVYRHLSEYVHGNKETWNRGGVKLAYQENTFETYCAGYKCVAMIILFSMICRYLKFIDRGAAETMSFITDEFGDVQEIREFFD